MIQVISLSWLRNKDGSLFNVYWKRGSPPNTKELKQGP